MPVERKPSIKRKPQQQRVAPRRAGTGWHAAPVPSCAARSRCPVSAVTQVPGQHPRRGSAKGHYCPIFVHIRTFPAQNATIPARNPHPIPNIAQYPRFQRATRRALPFRAQSFLTPLGSAFSRSAPCRPSARARAKREPEPPHPTLARADHDHPRKTVVKRNSARPSAPQVESVATHSMRSAEVNETK
jgi:hypothetical protein